MVENKNLSNRYDFAFSPLEPETSDGLLLLKKNPFTVACERACMNTDVVKLDITPFCRRGYCRFESCYRCIFINAKVKIYF